MQTRIGFLLLQEDAQLVHQALQGDHLSFSQLVARYERSVYAVCLQHLQNHASAEDARQDAFLAAYKHLASLKQPRAFCAWIHTIARRTALKHLRQQSRRDRQHQRHARSHSNTHQSTDPHEDRADHLIYVIKQLPKRQQLVVQLHYFDQQPVQTIAANLGCSVGTITKQLSRARVKLRHLINQEAQS